MVLCSKFQVEDERVALDTWFLDVCSINRKLVKIVNAQCDTFEQNLELGSSLEPRISSPIYIQVSIQTGKAMQFFAINLSFESTMPMS